MAHRPYQFIPVDAPEPPERAAARSAVERYQFWKTVRWVLFITGIVVLSFVLDNIGGALIIGAFVALLWRARSYRRRSEWGAYERIDRRPQPVDNSPRHPY